MPIVELDERAASILDDEPPDGFAPSFGGASYTPNLKLRAGDAVRITLYDYGALPLFGPADDAAGSDTQAGAISSGAHETDIPAQAVEADGSVMVPFAGRVRVGGSTPEEAAGRIVAALRGRATTPQAVVSLVGSSLNAASVGGDVANPTLLPLTMRGERILDAIASAGGLRYAASGQRYEAADCVVRLIRDGRAASVRLQRIVDRPEDDIVLRPGDDLFVTYEPRTFLVLGAARKVAQYDFETRTVTLAEAVARAGGPQDELANVGQLYLLRLESPETARRVAVATDGGSAVPVAYHLDLRQGAGYFVGEQVALRDKDVVLMTNANSVQIEKILRAVQSIVGFRYYAH